MGKSLHLHVGLPKCGSSSLQGVLRERNAELNAAGFDYPHDPDGPLPNIRAYLLGITGRTGDAVFRHNNPEVRLDRAVDDLWAAVEASEAPNVIFSTEELHRQRDESIIDSLTDRFDSTHVHIVLRPKVDWIISDYAQGTKTGRYDVTLEEYLAADRFTQHILPRVSYAEHVGFWQNRFGRDNTSIHFVARGFPSIVDQFFAAIGLDMSETESDQRRNLSPSAFQLSASIAANILPQPEFLKNRTLVERLAKKFDPKPEAGFLTAELEAQILPFLIEDTEALLKLQDRVGYDDLHPDNSAKHALAVSFREMVTSEAFAQLKDKLAEKGVALTNLRGVA